MLKLCYFVIMNLHCFSKILYDYNIDVIFKLYFKKELMMIVSTVQLDTYKRKNPTSIFNFCGKIYFLYKNNYIFKKIISNLTFKQNTDSSLCSVLTVYSK